MISWVTLKNNFERDQPLVNSKYTGNIEWKIQSSSHARRDHRTHCMWLRPCEFSDEIRKFMLNVFKVNKQGKKKKETPQRHRFNQGFF